MADNKHGITHNNNNNNDNINFVNEISGLIKKSKKTAHEQMDLGILEGEAKVHPLQ